MLLICDEVATGFGRTGTMFACEQEDVVPDLLCVGKGITGGYLPLAATLTTERFYEGFLGRHEDFRSFFHGHTYTGNPLGCAAGIATLETFERERTLEQLAAEDRASDPAARASRRSRSTVSPRSASAGSWSGSSSRAAARGAALGHQVTLAARRRGAIIRPLGDVVVLMPPLSIAESELRRLVAITAAAIDDATAERLRRRPPDRLSERRSFSHAVRRTKLTRGSAAGLASDRPAEVPRPRSTDVRSGQSSYGEKSRLRAPQTGQNHVSGMSSNRVPGGIPPSGSPSSGS